MTATDQQNELSPWTHELLDSRADWLKVSCVRGDRGGWDVALRIDGGYRPKAEGEKMARWWAEQLGVPYEASGKLG